jgi:hypothetical protein
MFDFFSILSGGVPVGIVGPDEPSSDMPPPIALPSDALPSDALPSDALPRALLSAPHCGAL